MGPTLDPTPRSSTAGRLGGALGGALGKEAKMQHVQQQMQEAGGDPVKLASAMMRASQYDPALGRALGPMFEALMTRQGEIDKAGGTGGESYDFKPSGGVSEEITDTDPAVPQKDFKSPVNVPQETARTPLDSSPVEVKEKVFIDSKGPWDQDRIIDESTNYVDSIRPGLLVGSNSFNPVPTFDLERKSDLRPDEEQNLRQDLLKRVKNPKVIDGIVGRVKDDIKTRYKEAITAYGMDKEQLAMKDAKWQQFQKIAPNRINSLVESYNPRAKQELTDKFYQYGESQTIDNTPESMMAGATQMLRRDMNRIDALSEVPSMPYVRSGKNAVEYLDNLRESYEPLANEGFIETIKEDAIVNKDAGIEEMHYMLYGGETIKNNKSNLDKYKAPNRNEKDFSKENRRYVNDISKELKNISATDDLVLLRGMVLDNGGTEQQFKEALSNAVEEGLQLSPFQESQTQEIRQPRMKPVHEIFQPKESKGFWDHAKVLGGIFGLGYDTISQWADVKVRGKK